MICNKRSHFIKIVNEYTFLCYFELLHFNCYITLFSLFFISSLNNTMCPRSSDPFYILYAQEVVTHFK